MIRSVYESLSHFHVATNSIQRRKDSGANESKKIKKIHDFVRGCFAFLCGEGIKRYSTRCLCINSIRRGLKCIRKWMDWSWLDGGKQLGVSGCFCFREFGATVKFMKDWWIKLRFMDETEGIDVFQQLPNLKLFFTENSLCDLIRYLPHFIVLLKFQSMFQNYYHIFYLIFSFVYRCLLTVPTKTWFPMSFLDTFFSVRHIDWLIGK